MENPKTIMMILALCFFNIAHQILRVNAAGESYHPLAPAIYVFGDSTVDAGNNNHLNTVANANRWPYAIDFHNRRGRHTNGKNVADFAGKVYEAQVVNHYTKVVNSITQVVTGAPAANTRVPPDPYTKVVNFITQVVTGAPTADTRVPPAAKVGLWCQQEFFQKLEGHFAMHLGLPMPPPYLNLTDSERSEIATGINYGSGACGILNTSRVGECLSLEQQIYYFTSTVTKDLPKQMDQNKLHHHLAKSIFLISIGLNDYNILANQNITSRYSPPDFADYLLDELSKHIEKMYNLGARKFVVNGISVCEPFEYTKENCSSRFYRDKLPEKILFLESKLPGSLFTIYDNYKVHKTITESHQTLGITDIQDACYKKEENSVCPDRTKYYYFDGWKHLTEVSCEIAMNGCINGTICAPYTLLELTRVHIPSSVVEK